ncbi:MAG: ParB/RepB/Spo0J family partition protein [Clostridiales bacterium]|nr:ParB/RepB/Spo0J family partition protein [Clostridiales bacterium]
MADIEMIPIERLENHPKNVRKEYGDIEALADSIRAQGVLQNLTVVQSPQDIDKYWVVIGNRRLMAAREAGLTELPCSIAEMDEPEQIETMIGENMQRSDLTVLEQADGVQMMLDLGETISAVAEKTGLSQTTVRHRAEIAKLDRSVLEKYKDDDGCFQLSITDLIELEKIDDIKKRNDILKISAKARNLAYLTAEAIDDQNRAKNYEKYAAMLDELGVKKSNDSRFGYYCDGWRSIRAVSLTADPDKEIYRRDDGSAASSLDVLKEEVEKHRDELESGRLYYSRLNVNVTVMKKTEDEGEDEDESQEEPIWKKKDRAKEQIDAIWDQMAAKRRDFILDVIMRKVPAIENTSGIESTLLNLLITGEAWLSKGKFARFFNGECVKDKEVGEIWGKAEGMNACHKLLCIASYMVGDKDIAGYDAEYWDDHAEFAKTLYGVLEEYGFMITDPAEKAVLDGTSDLYWVAEDDDTPDGQQEAEE